MAPKWTANDIPSLSVKVAVVPGSTSGIGYEVAFALAQAGAQVVLAVRNETKAHKAINKMKEAYGEAFSKLDILVNNAAITVVPEMQLTMDGFELMFATNYLGQYLLVNRLLQYLVGCAGTARVITVSSRLAKKGRINFDDLMGEKKYKSSQAYAQSKLANLIFAVELQKQNNIRGWGIMSIAANSGTVKLSQRDQTSYSSSTCFLCNTGQKETQAALSILFAATAETVVHGGYYGPQGCVKSKVGLLKYPKAALKESNRTRLWEQSLKLCNVAWPDNMYAFQNDEDSVEKTEEIEL